LKNKPEKLEHYADIALDATARKCDLRSSNIVNIIHYRSLQMLHQKTNVLTRILLMEGIKREYLKEDRLF